MSFISDVFSAGFPVLDAAQEASNAACGSFATMKLANTDANIIDLRDNWKPTGFYTVAQLNQILVFVAEVKGRAFDALSAAEQELQLEQHRDLLTKAEAKLSESDTGFRDGGQAVFLTAVQTAAQAHIDVIEAQGLKRWLVQVLRAARDVEFTTKLVGCARPALLFTVLQALNSAADTLVRFAKSVGEFVIAVGQAVLKIPDVIGTFLTVLGFVPWVVLLFGGYYAGVHTGIIKPRYDPMRLGERQPFKPWRRK